MDSSSCYRRNIMLIVSFIFASLFFHTISGDNHTISSEKPNTVSNEKPKLYIGGLFSLPKDLGTGTKGYHAMVGAEMATEDINNSPWILPNHEVVLLVNDTKKVFTPVVFPHYETAMNNVAHDNDLPTDIINCASWLSVIKTAVIKTSSTHGYWGVARVIITETTAVAMNGLYEMFYKPPVRIGMVGPVLSFITVEIAAVTGLWNFIQLSGAATSPALSDREKYPTFFRTVSSAAKLNLGYLEILKQMGWKRVAILTEAREPHLSVSANMQAILEENGIRVVVSKSLSDDISGSMKLIKDNDVRVIFGNFYEKAAYHVFCSAYKYGLYGRKYLWFIKGIFQYGWWHNYEGSDTCTPEQVKEAANGYFCATYSVFGRDETPAVTGITPSEFRRAASIRANYNFTMDGQEYMGIGYDALVALCLALNNSQKELPPGALENYQYGNLETTEAIKRNMYNLDFDGVSGHLSWSDDGGRIGDYLLKQNRDGTEEIVGSFDPSNGTVSWYYEDRQLWSLHGGAPPQENETIITRTVSIPISILIAISVICGLGFIYGCLFLAFNIVKRAERAIKMSSPKINNIITSGILLGFFCIVLLGIDANLLEPDGVLKLCKFRMWLTAMAFTLVFGGMFTKMWRVYSIVIYNKTKRKVIKDTHLFFIIGLLLLIDILILTPREIFDPYELKQSTRKLPQTEDDLNKYVQHEEIQVICQSPYGLIWMMTIILYKAFVMIFGVFLTWQTRNVTVPALNDSYYVGLAIYNTILCFAVAVPLSILNESSAGVKYVMESCLILFCLIATLSMLFIPKVLVMYGKQGAVGDVNSVGRPNMTATMLNPDARSRQVNPQLKSHASGLSANNVAIEPNSNSKSNASSGPSFIINNANNSSNNKNVDVLV